MNRFARTLLLAVLLAATPASALLADTGADPALLAAVGTLGGANAYTSYMAMGAVVDGWVHDVYPKDKVTRIAALLRHLAETSGAELQGVLASGAPHQGDRGYVQGMIDAYGALAQAAAAVATWVETGDRKAFDEARERAWRAIVTALADSAEEALE
jgi:hypothetical protein